MHDDGKEYGKERNNGSSIKNELQTITQWWYIIYTKPASLNVTIKNIT